MSNETDMKQILCSNKILNSLTHFSKDATKYFNGLIERMYEIDKREKLKNPTFIFQGKIFQLLC